MVSDRSVREERSSHLCICVTELDGDITLQLVAETDRVHTRNGLDSLRLSVRHVSNGSWAVREQGQRCDLHA